MLSLQSPPPFLFLYKEAFMYTHMEPLPSAPWPISREDYIRLARYQVPLSRPASASLFASPGAFRPALPPVKPPSCLFCCNN